MVTAPKCKVCGSAHFGAAHVWPGAMTQAETPSVIKVTAKKTVTVDLPPPKVTVDEVREAIGLIMAASPKRDRAAYMRQWRADHPKDKGSK